MRIANIAPIRVNNNYGQRNKFQKNNANTNVVKNSMPAADTVSFGMIKDDNADVVLRKIGCYYPHIKDSNDFIAYTDEESGLIKGKFTEKFLNSPMGKKHAPYMRTMKNSETLEDLGDPENARQLGRVLYHIEERRQGIIPADEIAKICAALNARDETDEERVARLTSYMAT